jgi:hypothetical protein
MTRSILTSPLRWRPIEELPVGSELINALIAMDDDHDDPDGIGAVLAWQLYTCDGQSWRGEQDGKPLPAAARYWLPEDELVAALNGGARR